MTSYERNLSSRTESSLCLIDILAFFCIFFYNTKHYNEYAVTFPLGDWPPEGAPYRSRSSRHLPKVPTGKDGSEWDPLDAQERSMLGSGYGSNLLTPLGVAVFGPAPILAGIAVSGMAQATTSMNSAVLGPRPPRTMGPPASNPNREKLELYSIRSGLGSIHVQYKLALSKNWVTIR
ncbi:unnamed protein product [Chilo suppressalis]|uniref:Uncharacterized protein n=1 Tax=Chilo suppressalis TaxID=168631 RepID=A0ABN8AZZ5_CHISP|nr:unnamed protein product [Chilo suppressalis]